jgi:hypothetical protein
MSEVKELIGKVMAKVEQFGDERIEFTTTAGELYVLFHRQDCCEFVTIEDVAGDLADLVGSPIVQAEEVVSEPSVNTPGVPVNEYQDVSFAWTFYKFGTAKGFVTIRWYGESTGYYSVSVDFERIDGDDNAS